MTHPLTGSDRTIDTAAQAAAITRAVSDGDGTSVGVRLERRYPADVSDVWEALTDPERIRRWMMPVSGDLREGGHFQLEGNAGGQILRCAPPDLLRLTFGGETSLVEVRLRTDGPETVLTLEHTVPQELAGSLAGALFVGPGWDGALLGLALHLDGQTADDPVAAASSPEAQEFCVHSIDAWVRVLDGLGTVDSEAIAGARQAAMAQFAPDLAG
jgi:uncharacterized protein YndB with AHSA1/START domain